MIEIISSRLLNKKLPTPVNEKFAVRITADANAERIVGLNRYLSEERRKLRQGSVQANKKRAS